MKVLFAVSNEEISQSIIKKYQKEYKEIISHKNVYYFNAILKEIQKDKSYDRIVISEDLEAFSHTQYDQIDKFIFDKLDSISDEASNMKGNDIPIILICSDRRTKSEQMLVKLFGIGVYNAILGNDRSVEEVCRLINRPRSKKEAKQYYKIDSEEVNYQAENENDVSEMEIQNILAHYRSLGKNEDRYIDSFNNIAAQYNDTQLRIITKFLPLNVRAVLEERSPKYQQIMSFNNSVANSLRYKKEKDKEEGTSEKLLKPKNKVVGMSKPVVIPSSVNVQGAKKLSRTKVSSNINSQMPKQQKSVVQNPLQTEKINMKEEPIRVQQVEENIVEQPIQTVEQPVKRGRGRPRKNPLPEVNTNETQQPKRKRGRPRKNPLPEQEEVQVKEEATILPGVEEIENNQEEVIIPGFEESTIDNNFTVNNNNTTVLPGFDDYTEDDSNSSETILPGVDDIGDYNEPEPNTGNNYNSQMNNHNIGYEPIQNNMYNSQPVTNEGGYNNYSNNNMMRADNNYTQTVDISSLLTSDKKIVTFVGTSKNGTSFIVNNVAELLSNMGINVAILDTTVNRNSYYIYTKNEEALRNIAAHSIEELSQGMANGIQVNQNLTVYTSLPDENDSINRVDEILETLVKNHSLILIDCDFNTPIGYFKQSQETYLIQSLDILTIQPLTAFLRELKAKNILDEKKLKVILNKYVKVRGVNEKTIIGGMAFYNDPAMSFMTELFDRTLMKYITIPFEEEIYVRYLEGIINCDISIKGYSKQFMQVLKELGNMIYPLVSGKGAYRPPSAGANSQMGTFSPSMNNTLNQMKRNF